MLHPVLPMRKPSLSLKRQIDAICDRFEEAWSAGKQPRIEDYLSSLPGSERGQLFQELLASELAIRQPVDPRRQLQ